MNINLTRHELIKLVQKIMNAEGTEYEIHNNVNILEKNVPHPEVSGLIFWPKNGEPTAEEVVNEALAYKPIQL